MQELSVGDRTPPAPPRMGFRDKPLDATIHVVTPENIAFEYRLAGPFRRLPALLLDYLRPRSGAVRAC